MIRRYQVVMSRPDRSEGYWSEHSVAFVWYACMGGKFAVRLDDPKAKPGFRPLTQGSGCVRSF